MEYGPALFFPEELRCKRGDPMAGAKIIFLPDLALTSPVSGFGKILLTPYAEDSFANQYAIKPVYGFIDVSNDGKAVDFSTISSKGLVTTIWEQIQVGSIDANGQLFLNDKGKYMMEAMTKRSSILKINAIPAQGAIPFMYHGVAMSDEDVGYAVWIDSDCILWISRATELADADYFGGDRYDGDYDWEADDDFTNIGEFDVNQWRPVFDQDSEDDWPDGALEDMQKKVFEKLPKW
jgi:hypothetical protein